MSVSLEEETTELFGAAREGEEPFGSSVTTSWNPGRELILVQEHGCHLSLCTNDRKSPLGAYEL